MHRSLLPASIAALVAALHVPSVVTLVVTLAAALAIPAWAQDTPKRKSGLWEINVDRGIAGANDGKTRPPAVMTQCVDQAKDDALHQMGHQMAREMKCTWTTLQRTPAGLVNESACDLGITKTRSRTVITGNFKTTYKMVIHTRYDPPMMGREEGTMSMEGKWVGACKPGQRPGDMTTPGGMTMNIYDSMDAKKK
jgi:hypothetical protein